MLVVLRWLCRAFVVQMLALQLRIPERSTSALSARLLLQHMTMMALSNPIDDDEM